MPSIPPDINAPPYHAPCSASGNAGKAAPFWANQRAAFVGFIGETVYNGKTPSYPPNQIMFKACVVGAQSVLPKFFQFKPQSRPLEKIDLNLRDVRTFWHKLHPTTNSFNKSRFQYHERHLMGNLPCLLPWTHFLSSASPKYSSANHV